MKSNIVSSALWEKMKFYKSENIECFLDVDELRELIVEIESLRSRNTFLEDQLSLYMIHCNIDEPDWHQE